MDGNLVIRMDVSLIKTIILLFGLLKFGAPDSWDIAVQARLTAYLPGPALSIGVNIDPVPIYYRPLDGDLCGVYYGVIVIDPEAERRGCRNTLQHELAHAWQSRSYGLLTAATYPLSPSMWEPLEPWHQTPPHKRVLEWALIRVWLPIGEER